MLWGDTMRLGKERHEEFGDRHFYARGWMRFSLQWVEAGFGDLSNVEKERVVVVRDARRRGGVLIKARLHIVKFRR